MLMLIAYVRGVPVGFKIGYKQDEQCVLQRERCGVFETHFEGKASRGFYWKRWCSKFDEWDIAGLFMTRFLTSTLA